MRNYTACLLFLVFPLNSHAMTAPENLQEAEDWYQSMANGVVKWAASPDKNVQISNLGDYVRKFGRKMPNHPDPRWHKVYEAAQAALIAIPGHAKYFADELERLRLDPKSNYERIRPTYLAETLMHLPSPETIQVLGHYLSDMQDMPYDENPKYNEAVHSGKIRPSDSIPLPQNAWLATCALSNIGLRNPPFEPVADYIFLRLSPSAESLPKFRAWWEEVKSGKRTFSFKGHNVEYRFKPDGTWDTIAMGIPPDDGPKAGGPPEQSRDSKTVSADDGPKVEKEAEQPRESKKARAVESSAEIGWTVDFRWVLGLAGLIIAVLGGIWKNRSVA